jgi:hypothetical protein
MPAIHPIGTDLIKRALVFALTKASTPPPDEDKHTVFLNALSEFFRENYQPHDQPHYQVAQKHDDKSKAERLYDISIFKCADVLEKEWGNTVPELSELFAAIEVENQQGPKYVYEDLWKVVFSRAIHRVFCGGIRSCGYGSDKGGAEKLKSDRVEAIKKFHPQGAVSGVFVAFYPHPDEWNSGVNYDSLVSVHLL